MKCIGKLVIGGLAMLGIVGLLTSCGGSSSSGSSSGGGGGSDSRMIQSQSGSLVPLDGTWISCHDINGGATNVREELVASGTSITINTYNGAGAATATMPPTCAGGTLDPNSQVLLTATAESTVGFDDWLDGSRNVAPAPAGLTPNMLTSIPISGSYGGTPISGKISFWVDDSTNAPTSILYRGTSDPTNCPLTAAEDEQCLSTVDAFYSAGAPNPNAPTVDSFTPTSGMIGTTVTIVGTNFSMTPANNTVMFNGVAATVSAATATTLTVTVPAGANTGGISVTVDGSSATSANSFMVSTPGENLRITINSVKNTGYSSTEITYLIENIGITATSNFQVMGWHDRATAPDYNSAQSGKFQLHGGIGPGGSETGVVTVDATSVTPGSALNAYVIADFAQEIAESDEGLTGTQDNLSHMAWTVGDIFVDNTLGTFIEDQFTPIRNAFSVGSNTTRMSMQGNTGGPGSASFTFTLIGEVTTAGTYAYSLGQVGTQGTFVLIGSDLYGIATFGPAPAVTITINQAAAPGGLVSGSYNMDLCLSPNFGPTGCTVPSTNFSGSFSIVRDPNQ